ncbi:hypothetical protein M2271_007262 [Streptomyces sp. LBL]|uniref:hypothetical protein n=1 Tax=Streptomyces sp. LBL TaxID=2940562 RepID=UPI002475FBBA|nr:hypothetical protein [Streptomyces sp. LBL]MDH6629426.1 hypothetical protein [Streptomyces sp. LBL]
MDRPIAPYVIPWKGETTLPGDIAVTSAGVAYADPVQDALHRDLDGVLWAMCGGTATGGPAYAAELHPERQKTTMEGLLCAGCKEPGDRDERGMLWILPLLDDAADTVWEGVHTAIPPMCATCADRAPRLCPQLGDGHVELRVREADQIGVRGTLHPRPGEPGEPDPNALALYDSPDLPFVIARQAVRELRRTTVVAFAAAFP